MSLNTVREDCAYAITAYRQTAPSACENAQCSLLLHAYLTFLYDFNFTQTFVVIIDTFYFNVNLKVMICFIISSLPWNPITVSNENIVNINL